MKICFIYLNDINWDWALWELVAELCGRLESYPRIHIKSRFDGWHVNTELGMITGWLMGLLTVGFLKSNKTREQQNTWATGSERDPTSTEQNKE